MKKVLSFILVLSMVLGSFGMAFADTTQPQSAVDKMVELGFVQGDEGGLRLNDTIKRSEVATIVTRVLGLEALATASNYQGRFTDVTPAHWANGNINVAAGRALVNGYPDGTFAPEGNITNNEAVTVMVRMVLNAEEIAAVEKSGVWPSNYLVKAAELGLLEGLNVANYGEAATRETLFTIAYNAYENLNEQEYYVVKALVIENDRVEKIGANEVVVEVIEEVQKADFAEKSRKEKGDQLRLELPANLGDVENLLGKVVDISLDKNEKVVKLAVDGSYQYLTGAATAKETKLTIGGKDYTVTLDERYNDREDRVFRTYLNNDALSYKAFYQDATRAKDVKVAEEFKADYARVTIKNGKVIFIDAYKFDDIAPVQEVKKDGEEVVVYDDIRDGATKKYTLKATTPVLVVEEGVVTKGSRADIAANDVVHEYKNGYIVRKDAVVNGTFEKISEARDGKVYAHVDGEEYLILTTDYKRPVYSYDSEEFYTLLASNAENTLKEFREEKVTVLLDLAGNLQYIGSEIELGEFVALVTRVVGRDIRVLKTDGKTYDFRATLDTKVDGSTGHKSLQDLDAGNLVYISVDGEAIEKINVLATKADEVTITDLTNREIQFATGSKRVLSETNLFVAHDNTVRTLKEVVDAFDDNKEDGKVVKAFLVDGKEFADYTRRAESNITRETEAHTIVFTVLEIKANVETKIVEFNGFADKQENKMNIILADGTKETRTVKLPTGVKLPTLIGGDIIEIDQTKDDNKDIKAVNFLINGKNINNTFEVVEYNKNNSKNLIVRDKFKNPSDELYVDGKTVVFGGDLRSAERVSYVLDGATRYIKAVLIREKRAEVTGVLQDAPLATNRVTYMPATVNTTDRLIAIGNTEYTVSLGAMEFFNRYVTVGDKIAVELNREGQIARVTIYDGNITVNANDTFTDLVIGGDLTVTNNAKLTTKEITVKGDVVVDPGSEINSNTTFEGNVTVNGTATFTNVNFGKNTKLVVNGTVTIKGTTGSLAVSNIVVAPSATLDTTEAKNTEIKNVDAAVEIKSVKVTEKVYGEAIDAKVVFEVKTNNADKAKVTVKDGNTVVKAVEVKVENNIVVITVDKVALDEAKEYTFEVVATNGDVESTIYSGAFDFSIDKE